MPRLSLYRTEKGNDYDFIDKQIYEMFTVGGTELNIHKYIGTDDGEVVKDHTQIQDLLFLENRDRVYDKDIYSLRGIYNVQDIDFDLSQFGLFLSNDIIFLTVHINSSVKTIGRKLMPGDVIELPHLKDPYAENDYSVALKRFYVIEEINRAAEGFSPTWYPHLYRLKLKQIADSQEYADILDQPASEDSDETLREIMSSCQTAMLVNDAVVTEAEADSNQSGYDISHYFTLSVEPDGLAQIRSASETDIDASGTFTADQILAVPKRLGYDGYLLGYDEAPNGAPFGVGTTFPPDSQEGDFILRVDFMPNRMFRYDGIRWIKMFDSIRMTLTNDDQRKTLLGTFVNNTTVSNIGGDDVVERQGLSKALRPKPDN